MLFCHLTWRVRSPLLGGCRGSDFHKEQDDGVSSSILDHTLPQELYTESPEMTPTSLLCGSKLALLIPNQEQRGQETCQKSHSYGETKPNCNPGYPVKHSLLPT